MYHLTACQYYSNQPQLQSNSTRTTSGDYTHHPQSTMTHNTTYHRHHDTCSHSHYAPNSSLHSQRIQYRTNAFSEFPDSHRIYEQCHSTTQPVYDQLECVRGNSHNAHNQRCCNQSNVGSSPPHASCRMNINPNPNRFCPTAATNPCSHQFRDIHVAETQREIPQRQQCMSHSHTSHTNPHPYMDHRHVSIHPEATTTIDIDRDMNHMNHMMNNHQNSLSDEYYPNCFDTALVEDPSNGYNMANSTFTPRGMTSMPCTPSPGGSNTVTDSISTSQSHSLTYSPAVSPRDYQQPSQKLKQISNASMNANAYVPNRVPKADDTILQLPTLQQVSDKSFLHTASKDIKSNRGRKKIDRSEYLNANGRYQCKLCPKSYKRYNDLKGHYAIHNDNTECCPHCQKKFSRPIYLRDHIRTHTGEKPFNCDICHKQFAAKRNLVQHRKRHFRANSRLIGYQGE